MRFFFKKDKAELPKHRWYAWYPVWAWDGDYPMGDDVKLGLVWLEYVYAQRRNGVAGTRWTYYTIDNILR